jgi:lipopolysaccharide biosynthesis glycosyltransferase
MTLPDPREIVVVCAADQRYVQPLAVMLHSALANLDPSRRLLAYVVDGGLGTSGRRDLTKAWDPARAEARFVLPGTESLVGLPLWGRMSVATYYKLLVPELLPPEVAKVIWLDCDCVVTGDLAQLWKIDLADHHLLAVPDTSVPTVSAPGGVAPYRRLGIAPDARYFNAGVMVMNLDLWRRDGVPSQAFGYLREYRDTVVFWDQEALNAVLPGKWDALDPRWNCIANPRGAGDRARDPWIHHFTGSLKPWVCPSAEPSHALYFRYLDQTAWAGWRPDRSLVRTVLGTYQTSRLRRVLYPAEERLMRLLRAFTRRDACAPSSR